MKTKSTTQSAPREAGEQVGRIYKQTRYGVHSRRVGGNGTWYGTNHYKTREEARVALRSVGAPILGGLVTFAGGKDPFEYRIVRVEMECTVEHVETQLV